MSELTIFNNGAVIPDYLRRGTDELTKTLAGGSVNKTISIEGGVWRLIVGGEEIAKNEDRAMNFVVVNAHPHTSRAYYASTYVKGRADAPACFSSDGKVPDAAVKNPQSPDCNSCPQNIQGSGSGNSRACRFFQRVAVVLEGDIGGNVYRLQLPAKSIFGRGEDKKLPFRAYAVYLAGHGLPIGSVVTEARFDTNEAVPVLRFSAVRPLSERELEISRSQKESEEARYAIETKFVSREQTQAPALAAPAFQPSASASSRMREVVESLDEEDAPPAVQEAAPEPVRRSSRKPAAPAPAQRVSAADIVNEWASDDDD